MNRNVAIFAVALFLTASCRADFITFEDLPLPGPGTYQNGANLTGSFTSGGATFNNIYDPTFDVWSGWAYSNVVDTTSPGYTNQYAAFSKSGGDGSATYGVAGVFYPGNATISFAPGSRPTSMRITNTTYAALSMQNGDQFAKKFGGATGNDPDFFLLTITGLDTNGGTTGLINFYLADYRSDDNNKDFIINDWTTVDLSPLGIKTAKLSFGLSSSDNGAFGMNTPAYFAMDNLQTAAPEPGSMILTGALAMAAAGGHLRRRRTSRASAK